MKRIYKHIFLIPACMLGVMLASCVKERFEDGYEDMDGESMVSFELQGTPLQSALTRTAGNAIQKVDTLYILFYTASSTKQEEEADYKLAYAFTSDKDCKNEVFSKGLEITNREYMPRPGSNDFKPTNDSEWKGVAESKTQHVTTAEVQVKRGYYAVYVVANVNDFSEADFDKDKIETVGKLRKYQLEWNTEVAKNNAMFGFFTEENAPQQYDVIHETANPIKISSKAVTLHAWVKRAVSKVTVAFDGSKLNENIRIYIKSVKIHDIPKYCRLGADNKPGYDGEPEDLLYKREEESNYQITYSDKVGADNDTRISKREPYFPGFSGLAEDEGRVTEWKKEVHSETSNALYFFENLQGTSNGEADADGSWKQQTDIDRNGIPDDRDHNNIQKDTKDYGTYIEVEAYYQNDNYGSRSEGNIIYRFMLGKNITDDFNAERNNHYKLTLCFKNNANDVDWHIEYNEKDYEIEDTIYVSYEYNTPTILPVRFVDKEVKNLRVTIDSSNWFPDDTSLNYYKGATTPSGLATGFLSLTYDNNPRIGSNDETFNAEEDNADAGLAKKYWDDQKDNTTREYVNSDGNKVDWPDLDDHGYSVTTRTTSEGRTVFEANIPMFTRPLIIYKWTSWTGANPYYTSSRSAVIRLTGNVGGESYTKTIKVVQVPRIENPSGIYRRHDNDDEFDVTCMARTGEMYNSAISFAEFNSVGAWRAVIYRSSDGDGNKDPNNESWFTLTAGSQKADAIGEYIQGDPDSPIKFRYKPKGKLTDPNEVRCGVIKVEYNNYACTHYIFVRQGYAPMRLENDKVYWHTFNLYSGNAEAIHPCEAGSFFIRGRWAPAILDSNTAGYGEAVTRLRAFTDEAGTTTGNVSIPIVNTGNNTRQAFPKEDKTFSGNNATYNPWNSGRVPTLEEWATLKDENSDATIDKGFGVLYADGVNSTLTNPTDVWGCLHANVNTANGNASRGMRGAFVYNSNDGRNIFLPIGATGYGRRKVGNVGTGNSIASGRLQYSFSDTFFPGLLSNQYRPLLYNLNTNEGAIYWAQDEVAGMEGSTHPYDNGWDINYKTYDFDFMEAASVNKTTGAQSPSNRYSACYIRLVQTEAPE